MSPSQTNSTNGTAQIGVTGLAVMGSNIARNFARHGYTVALAVPWLTELRRLFNL